MYQSVIFQRTIIYAFGGGINDNMKVLATVNIKQKLCCPLLLIYYFNLMVLLEKLRKYTKSSIEFVKFYEEWQKY